MALIHITTNGTETGLTAATKINTSFTKVDLIQTSSGLETNGSYIADQTTNYLAGASSLKGADKLLDTKIFELTQVEPCVSVLGGVKPTQPLTPNSPSLLNWMDSYVINQGNGSISANIPGNMFAPLTEGIYKIEGNIVLTAPNNDVVKIELYKNGVATGHYSTEVGKGESNTITLSYNLYAPFLTNEYLSLYVTSNGNAVTVKGGNMTMIKTKY